MHIATHGIVGAHAEHLLPRRRYAWWIFTILVGLMVVDYVDRQVVVSMFPHLKVEWGLTDTQLGSLVSIVSIVVALGTVPLSLLADRWSRVKSIVLMALVWSCATIACSFAQDYGHLIAARGLVGLGEAAYGSAGGPCLRASSPEAAQHGARRLPGRGPRRIRAGVVLGGVIAENWGCAQVSAPSASPA
jgi:predicted MFS family arabinose efflux permease